MAEEAAPPPAADAPGGRRQDFDADNAEERAEADEGDEDEDMVAGSEGERGAKRGSTPRGVWYDEKRQSKPYIIQKTTNKKQQSCYFATVKEAVRALEAYRQSRDDAKLAKQLAVAAAAPLRPAGASSSAARSLPAAPWIPRGL